MNPTFVLDDRVVRLIDEGSRFALLTHINADGDGLGSQMALYAFLRDRGKQPRMINHDPVPANYRFLRLASAVERYGSGDGGAFVEDADGIFVLDNGSLARLGGLEPHVRKSRAVKVCVDHHETRDNCWDLAVVDPRASASGELVHEIIRALGGEMTVEIAEALYVSIVTDTGHFRFSKTRPVSHRIAAELLEQGIRPDEMYEQIFENNAEGFIRLMGQALLQMRREAGGALAWSILDRDLSAKVGAAVEDIGPIINILLSMSGVRLAILFRELEDGQVKVSLRSKGEVDVHRLALRHGGGGHRNAAGILFSASMEESTRRLVDEARALVGG